jgi:hypothetical protein
MKLFSILYSIVDASIKMSQSSISISISNAQSDLFCEFFRSDSLSDYQSYFLEISDSQDSQDSQNSESSKVFAISRDERIVI